MSQNCLISVRAAAQDPPRFQNRPETGCLNLAVDKSRFLIIIFIVVNMDGFPSGQRERTVNPLSQTTMVRIHPRPPNPMPHAWGIGFGKMKWEDSKPVAKGSCGAFCRAGIFGAGRVRSGVSKHETRCAKIESIPVHHERNLICLSNQVSFSYIRLRRVKLRCSYIRPSDELYCASRSLKANII